MPVVQGRPLWVRPADGWSSPPPPGLPRGARVGVCHGALQPRGRRKLAHGRRRPGSRVWLCFLGLPARAPTAPAGGLVPPGLSVTQRPRVSRRERVLFRSDSGVTRVDARHSSWSGSCTVGPGDGGASRGCPALRTSPACLPRESGPSGSLSEATRGAGLCRGRFSGAGPAPSSTEATRSSAADPQGSPGDVSGTPAYGIADPPHVTVPRPRS